MIGYFLTCTKQIGAGIAVVSMAGTGVGIGTIFGSFMIAFSKNPSLEKKLFTFCLMGFALTEVIALMGFMMSFVILFT